jgi:hypothetical protein
MSDGKPTDSSAETYGPVDFSMHVMSLASSAMVALGRMAAPDGNPHPIELEMAKHLIDVLDMLAVKTKGNLDESETKLLSSLIHDLRGGYVESKNQSRAKP